MNSLDFVDLLTRIRTAKSIKEINLIYGSFDEPEQVVVEGHDIKIYSLSPKFTTPMIIFHVWIWSFKRSKLNTVKKILIDNCLGRREYGYPPVNRDDSNHCINLRLKH